MSNLASLLLLVPSGQGGPGLTVMVLQFAAIIAIFYFIMIRPQRRQQEEHNRLLASLQRGDKVVTTSAIVGEVVHIKEDEITIRSGEAKFVIMRNGISNITNRTLTSGPQASPPAVEAKSK